jgi:hypothetical protein
MLDVPRSTDLDPSVLRSFVLVAHIDLGGLRIDVRAVPMKRDPLQRVRIPIGPLALQHFLGVIQGRRHDTLIPRH